jgi:hypothetical protein
MEDVMNATSPKTLNTVTSRHPVTTGTLVVSPFALGTVLSTSGHQWCRVAGDPGLSVQWPVAAEVVWRSLDDGSRHVSTCFAHQLTVDPVGQLAEASGDESLPYSERVGQATSDVFAANSRFLTRRELDIAAYATPLTWSREGSFWVSDEGHVIDRVWVGTRSASWVVWGPQDQPQGTYSRLRDAKAAAQDAWTRSQERGA